MDTIDRARSASWLSLHLEIDSNAPLRTRHYDNSDDINFLVVNFPFVCKSIPGASACGNICVTNDHGYVTFVVITNRFFPHT
jgi:hypothetical protein